MTSNTIKQRRAPHTIWQESLSPKTNFHFPAFHVAQWYIPFLAPKVEKKIPPAHQPLTAIQSKLLI